MAIAPAVDVVMLKFPGRVWYNSRAFFGAAELMLVLLMVV